MVVNEAKMASRFLLLFALLCPAFALGQSLPQPQVRMQPENDNSNRAASTSYVDRSVQILLNSIAGKAPLSSPSFTGTASFANRPTFGGATPWDSGNLNPSAFAPLASPAFTGTAKTDTLQILGAGSSGDVSGMSLVGPTETLAKSLAARFAELPHFVDAYKGGACASAPDDTCALQAAVDAAAGPNGNGRVEIPARVLTITRLILKSNVRLTGKATDRSTLRLKNGANMDLIMGENAYSLFGTDTIGGISGFEISHLTLDGNRTNNTTGSCIALFGYSYRIHDITINNCPEHGIRSEWGRFGEAYPMESDIYNIKVDTVGKIGVNMNGPNDSTLTNITVVDAGALANNTYPGFYFGPKYTARVSNIHPWHRSTATNRVNYGLHDSSGGANVGISHLEGSQTAPLLLAGQNSQYDSSNTYYAPWGTGSASVILTGKSNRLSGTILGSVYMPGKPPRIGVYVGPEASGNMVDLNVLGSSLGSIDVSAGDAGYNDFKIRGSTEDGNGYVGSFNATTSVDLQIFGATFNGRLLKDASAAPPATANAACTYGQRAFDTDFEYRCTGPSTWKRSPLSTW